ncbi:MAG: AI-2E family transporter [Alphaproteobacteria bacterium]|nr:AI-2E family transporter [Alphaproteobacteria bacterium]
MTAPARLWAGAALALAAFLYLLQDILLPFVAGLAIAYFFDPLVDRLDRHRVPRGLGALMVLIVAALAAVAVGLLLVPLLQAQIGDLIRRAPAAVEALQARLMPLAETFIAGLSPDDMKRIQEAAGGHVGTLFNWLAKVAERLLTSGAAFLNLLGLLFVTPIVAFYLLRDWDRVVDRIDALLPRRHRAIIHEQAARVDATLAGYIRGQATVCLVLGVFYAAGLVLAGLDFGLVVGLLAGFISFVPYVGTLFGLVASVGLAAAQFTQWPAVALVGGIFVVGQILEGYVLTPRLVGERVGLHPVWVMFALFAGGALFGFLGMLVALPVAAVAGVLIRFALARYRLSRLYLDAGHGGP